MVVCKSRQELRGDGSEVLFGNAVVLGGLDSGPDVAVGWRVFRVAVKTFDKFLRMVAWSTRGFQDERGQVDTEVPVKLFLFFAFGHVARAGTGHQNESSVRKERRDIRWVNVTRFAGHNVRFGLRTGLGLSWEAWNGLLDEDLGAQVCVDDVGQAPGDCGVTLVDAAPALANDAL